MTNSSRQKISGQADIALSISITNDFSEDAISNTYGFLCKDQERTLTYQIDYNNQELHITPLMEYLTKLKNGMPITDLGLILVIPPFFKWQFPNLDLRIVNNSDKTIYITDIFIDVEKSYLNPYPVLVLPGEEPNALHFWLINDGWGEVQDAVARFNLVPKGYPISFEESYQHEVRIGDFCDSVNVDISRAIKELGVDVDFINGFNNRGEEYHSIHAKMGRFFSQIKEFMDNKEDEEYKTLMSALGIFKNSDITKRPTFAAIAVGEICFTGKTANGDFKRDTIKFSSEVPLLVPGGYGAPGGPTYQYMVKLDVDRDNYKVRVQGCGSSVSQYLKSGDIDRFNIRVGALKSSLHKFRIRLVYNDNQSLLSPALSLNMFVPKSEEKSARGLDTLRIDQGIGFAAKGDTDIAINKFDEALKQNPELTINPIRETQKLSASFLLKKAREFVDKGKFREAINLYVTAKRFDPELEISAYSWETNIWAISQFEHIGERILIANSLYESLIEKASDYQIKWHPKSNPPNEYEVLVWWWVVNPSLWQSIDFLAPMELVNAVKYYNSLHTEGSEF